MRGAPNQKMVLSTTAIAMPRRMPTQQVCRASSRCPAPMAWPASIDVALPSASGTMNATAARFAAIWCAPETTGPSRAMNSAIKVNAVTSATNVTPIGMPSRRKSQMALKSGATKRLRNWNCT